MPFESVTLNNGREMPQIAFGTGSIWRCKCVMEYTLHALHAGFSHIDAGQEYGNEHTIGEALRQSGLARSETWITTKYWPTGGVRENLIKSLEQLGTTYVDLYLIQGHEFTQSDMLECWRDFENVAREGLAKSIGVSNFSLEDLQLLMKHANIKPAVNQIEFNPYRGDDYAGLLEYCTEHKIVLQAYSPLAPLWDCPGGPVEVPIQAAAERLNATPAQVLLLWVKAKGLTIVTTTSHPSRLEEYIDTGDLPPLTSDEVSAIGEAGTSWTFAGIWQKIEQSQHGRGTKPPIIKIVVASLLILMAGYKILSEWQD